jgi:hypothetical protein
MSGNQPEEKGRNFRKIPVREAAGMPLAHDITEARPGEWKEGGVPERAYHLRI